ncbi:piggyBac transposable element-derived protein 2-like [Sitophilus oryzae]|uniref:PiggyBac transposable element-derived protein 2-like n=1 Tax=Sitophilus oryzae TaxID=7048 RepID=A0A6J2YAP0_SITOR|nr:piggyBac transposable element-derived protein 2-like [Sitophilus oryzae]
MHKNSDIIQQPPIWGKTERPESTLPFVQPTGTPEEVANSNATPYSLFQLFFDEVFVNHLVFHTNLYAEQEQMRPAKTYKATTFDEINAFLGINLLMGIKRLPSYKNYWFNAPDLHDSYISSLMSQKRFGWLLGHLHINDNSTMPNRDSDQFDRLYKVQPLLDHLEKAFKNALLPSEVLALDESMIKF